MRNPFKPRYPIEPEFFADRERQIKMFERDLRRTLDSRYPENIAILGDWGVGKSSLAYKFAHIAANMKGAKILSTGIEVPKTIKSIDEFCFLLLFKLNQDIASSKNITNKLREEIGNWRIRALGIGPFTVERGTEAIPKIPFIQLQSYLIELWKDYLAKEGIECVVIVIDDIHLLLDAVKGGILDLRSVFQALPRYGCNYQLIITGPKTLFGEIRELAEPVVRFFSTYEIDCMNLDETKEMITFPLKKAGSQIRVTHDVIERIHEKTKGHPYFIAFFMQILVEECKGNEIDTSLYDRVLPEITRELETQKFEKDVGMVSEGERGVLSRIARQPEEEVSFTDISPPGKKSLTSKMLDRLVEKNLVIKSGRGRYRLYHPLFKEHLNIRFKE